VYAWRLDFGRVYLAHRYMWDIRSPTSPFWLNFLDEDSYVNQLFTEDTRHVLWCGDAKCAVRHRRQWFSMVKANLTANKDGILDSSGPRLMLYRDYVVATERSEYTGYIMPPQ
jgi:hypothetical protein